MAVKKHFPVILLMLAATFLRLWSFADLPFMYDEFSALLRTHYNSLSELIRVGVMENDSHPAGVQVFLYYWVKMTGFNEFWVKLPFAVMGISSVFLIYLIGKLWFNETTAIIAACWVSVMQFFVFYSQLARPYAAGLFAVLLLVWIWTSIVQANTIKGWKWFFLSLSLVVATLMHAFALVMAGLIYLSGFFLINKPKRQPYLLSGIVAIVLYSPHIPVFWHQLQDGTIGGWLGAPEPDFGLRFFRYAYHYSWVFMLISFMVILTTFSLKKSVNPFSKSFRLHAIAWFFITFFTAYIYSIVRSPIIQFSTLYFSFPFVLLVLASFARNVSLKAKILIVSLLLMAGIYTLLNNRKHYELMYKQGFDQIAVEASADQAVFSDSLLILLRSARPQMPAFYMDRAKVEGVFYFSKEQSPADMFALLEQYHQNYSFLAFGWTDYARLDWLEVARDFFPFVVKQNYWFNASYYLLAKDPVRASVKFLDNEQVVFNSNQIGINAEAFDSGKIYGSLFEEYGHNIFDGQNDLLMISSGITAIDTLRNLRLVIELRHTESNELLYWQAGTLLSEVLLPGQWQRLHTTARLGNFNLTDQDFLVRSYLWNQDAASFYKHDHRLKTAKQHPKILGLFEPL